MAEMSFTMKLNVELKILLDGVRAIQGNPSAALEPHRYKEIFADAAAAMENNIGALPYEIKTVQSARHALPAETMNITVKRNDGSTISIQNVERDATLSELKDEIQLKTGLLPKSMNLLFDGERLGYDELFAGVLRPRNLAQYGVIDGSVIDFAFRQVSS